MAFQVIPESFLDRMIKGWVQLLRKFINFLAIDNTVLWKNCEKIQQLSRVSTFRLQINAPNGTFSQPESTAGACCDARNCFDAHTEWIKEVIRKTTSIGLKVQALVMDMSTQNDLI